MSGKQGGLGARFLVGGYDISGDVNALDSIGGGPALLDGTDITQLAHSRIPALRDGQLGFTVFMDTADAHPVLSARPTTDELMTFLVPPLSVGSPACCLNAKQINYDPTRGADGSLLIKVEGHGNLYGLEWGTQLTPGLRTDTGATNGASFDAGGGFTTPGFPGSGTPVTNTSPLPASVVISGGTVGAVTVNGLAAGSGDGTYTVPSGQTIAVAYTGSPAWTWTLQTVWGAQGYLQCTAFTGTSVTATIQHAPDNATWSTLAAFTAVTAAPATQRVVVSNATTVARYLRVISAGTFTNAAFAVVLDRNLAAGVSF